MYCPFSLYLFPPSFFIPPISSSLPFFFCSLFLLSRQELEEVDNDTKEGEGKESGKGGGGGYQTSWGPVGYSRKDHCLQILVSEILIIFMIIIVFVANS